MAGRVYHEGEPGYGAGPSILCRHIPDHLEVEPGRAAAILAEPLADFYRAFIDVFNVPAVAEAMTIRYGHDLLDQLKEAD
jgi:hypothetical protein